MRRQARNVEDDAAKPGRFAAVAAQLEPQAVGQPEGSPILIHPCIDLVVGHGIRKPVPVLRRSDPGE